MLPTAEATAAVLSAALLSAAAVLVATVPAGAGASARLRGLRLPASTARPPGPDEAADPGDPVGPGPDAWGAPSAPGPTRARRRWPHRGAGAAVLAAVGVAAVVPLPAGPVLGLVVAVLTHRALARLSRREPPPAQRVAADVPPVLDLLASCLAAGAPLPDALAVVADATPGPLRPLLASSAAALLLGTPPEQALLPLRRHADLGPAGSVLTRAAVAGLPAADAVSRLAEEQRARAGEAARAAARRAGVLVVLPLGLCFLPAFVLLGVVPVVAGVAGRLLA